MTALIIDDEAQIRRLLKLALESKGFVVHEAAAGQLGLQEAAFSKPDVVLLDLGLPDMDGLQVLKRLREWSEVPVLFCRCAIRRPSRSARLKPGPMITVTKPFGTAELLARLHAILRRKSSTDEPEIVIGPLTLDLLHHTASLDKEPVKLTPTEFALLKLLARHAAKS